MAPVRLDAATFLAIPWHDATILAIQIVQADDGVVEVVVQCALHPDEPRALLEALGLPIARLAVRFHDPRAVRLTLNGDTSHRECIDRWTVTPAAAAPGQHCYHLLGSAGSTLAVETPDVWLAGI